MAKTTDKTAFEVLWDAAVPIENALLQTSVRFMGKEEGSLHKFMGAEFRVTSDWSVLMKHKGHFAFVPNTNVKIGYFKNSA